jgi:hypothetical protein
MLTLARRRARRGQLRRGRAFPEYPGVLVQIADPRTGHVIHRLPGVSCRRCGDVVLAGVGIDSNGRCARCAPAKETH